MTGTRSRRTAPPPLTPRAPHLPGRTTSAYWSPLRHVSTQYTTGCVPAQRAQEPLVLRPSSTWTHHASRPGVVVHPAELGEYRGQESARVNQLVVPLPAGSTGAPVPIESARRSGDGRWASSPPSPSRSPSRGMPPAASPAWASGVSPPGVSRPASQRATHGASLDAEDGPPSSSVAHDPARTLAGVGPVLSGGAPSRVRFTGEPAAPDARSSAESARSRRDRRTPGGAGEARPSETRDGGSRSSSRGWQ